MFNVINRTELQKEKCLFSLVDFQGSTWQLRQSSVMG